VKNEHEVKETVSSPVQPMKSPTGIDLYPTPPLATRLKKSAVWIVASVLLMVLAVVCLRIYQRQSELSQSGIVSDPKKRVEPAIRAGKEITKDIPVGVANLAEESKKPELDKGSGTLPQTAANSVELNRRGPAGWTEPRPTAAPAPTPVYPPVVGCAPTFPTATTPEPKKSLADEHLARAYERELQAIASPISIQGERGENSGSIQPPPLGYPSSNMPSTDAGVTALINALRGGNVGATIGERQVRMGGGEADDSPPSSRKEAFLATARRTSAEDYLSSTRTLPVSKYEIKAGWEIPAVLEQDINSDLPGELKALVTANVYDTATGQYLLIPQGARLIGTYNSAVGYGEKRLQAVWNRIIFPDASWVDLGGMFGQDAQGSSGFRQDVDNHYKRLLGFAVLTSVFSAGFQLSQTQRTSVLQTPSAGEIAAGAVGQNIGQMGTEITRRNLNVQPTIKAHVGYKFNVRVNRDILFESPYELH
jgi:type IV secretory pathway VirB10-like protein